MMDATVQIRKRVTLTLPAELREKHAIKEGIQRVRHLLTRL